MNQRRNAILTIAIILSGMIGVGYWVWLSEQPPDPEEPVAIPSEEAPAAPVAEAPGEPEYAVEPEVAHEEEVVPPRANAIPNERVYRFGSAQELEGYLEALRGQGLSPLGVLRGLNAVRLSDRAARQVDPRGFGAETEDNLYSSRPFPIEAQPSQRLARLRPFGETARDMVSLSPRATGEGILVAVLDNGVDADLEANQFRGAWIDYVGGEGAYEHGTAVASIIAGPTGVAPDAVLLNVRVLDETGVGNSFDLARGIVEATDFGAKVINMSLGVYGESRLLRDAITYASDRGVILVASAGNEGLERLPLPAADERVLSVTAIDADRSYPNFPNRSKDIDIAAPGVGIVAVGSEGEKLFSGTSAAAPLVSGTVAALRSENPMVSPSGVVAMLKENLDDAGAPGADPLFGGGILNWDRLARRDRHNLVDIGIADIFLDPQARPGQSAPIMVTVQNFGTAWISGARLTVRVAGRPAETVTMGSLDSGAVAMHTVYADVPLPGSPPLEVVAMVELTGTRQDVDPENNFMARRFSFAE